MAQIIGEQSVAFLKSVKRARKKAANNSALPSESDVEKIKTLQKQGMEIEDKKLKSLEDAKTALNSYLVKLEQQTLPGEHKAKEKNVHGQTGKDNKGGPDIQSASIK